MHISNYNVVFYVIDMSKSQFGNLRLKRSTIETVHAYKADRHLKSAEKAIFDMMRKALQYEALAQTYIKMKVKEDGN